ncbi:MAG: DUF1254 domain-containing protein [Burkholderiales bacterium]|nr:DUF1254 domain-containing protein [Burkholderiales bacterium]
MARMRAATTARRHTAQGYAGQDRTSTLRWVNQFTHTRRLLGPEDREVVTPNNDTLFSNTWLDLSQGPVLIEVPEIGDRYWTLGFLDAWTNPWAYAGRRTTGGRAQRVFVHGPRWKGDAPEGAYRISAPGDDVWIIGRILVDNDPADVAAVCRLQEQFAIRRPDGSDALSRLDTLLDGQGKGVPDATEYLDILAAMMERNPPARALAHWPPPADALPAALDQVYTELRADPQPSMVGGGWSIAVMVRTDFGDDYLTRARVARNWIGTLGIEEAMYVITEVDAGGEALHGSHRYQLRFGPGEEFQVDSFWSITLYGSKDRLLVANPIGRHSIGDRTRGIRRDADGGLSMRIQTDDPGPDANWLPAPRGEPFYLVLRLYQPRSAHLEGSYRYPPVTRLD